jgi:fused signal recognition particle receptor
VYLETRVTRLYRTYEKQDYSDMFGFGKKSPAAGSVIEKTEKPRTTESEQNSERGFFRRLIQGLGQTRSSLGEGLSSLLLGSKQIDAELLREVETRLLGADVGLEVTNLVINNLKQKLDRRQLGSPQQFLDKLKEELTQVLEPCEFPLQIAAENKPFVILIVGVNGVGKTTTIGKLAKRLQMQGLSLVLAAGDTFRAAAVEQLQEWGRRNAVPVVAQASGADSASVIFDAYQSAKAKQADVLIADTAGRLHNKDNLMQELEKIVRVLRKQDANLPNEIMLVLDATTGQNAMNQARSFHAAVNLTGICLTKLDGTAKGGMVFALSRQLGLPIRFIGIGEHIDDLQAFNAGNFVEALFSK